MNSKNLLITLLVAVVVCAAGFFAGIKYQSSQSNNMMYGQSGQAGQGRGIGGRFGRNGMMATFGKVVNSDNNSITIQLQDGSSKIINLSGSTKILKTDTASQSSLTNGINVAVFGPSNSDGSINAQNIQINPQMRMRPQQGQ